MTSLRASLAAGMSHVRRAIWHLRTGGINQLRKYLFNARHGARRTVKLVRSDSGVNVAAWEWPDRAPTRDVTALVIADDFTLAALRYEWRQIQADPQTWAEQLDGVDLLFVESAWAANGGAWRYQLTGSRAPSVGLRALVTACRERAIPTIFWNKEDPAHFDANPCHCPDEGYHGGDALVVRAGSDEGAWSRSHRRSPYRVELDSPGSAVRFAILRPWAYCGYLPHRY